MKLNIIKNRLFIKLLIIRGICRFCMAMVWVLAWPFILIGGVFEDWENKTQFQYDLANYLNKSKNEERGKNEQK